MREHTKGGDILLGPEHIRQYQLFLIKDKKASQSTCIQLACALRFFSTHTLNHKIEIQRIPFPRRERKLPLILSRKEVKALLEAPGKLRDPAVLAVLYGSGLPVAEAVQLKPRDIDAQKPSFCSRLRMRKTRLMRKGGKSIAAQQ